MKAAPRLVLDEMHAPFIAEQLRQRGHDVLAIAADPDLRALSDEELFNLAAPGRAAPLGGRRIVTENVKDFRPLLRRSEEAGRPTAGILFTSSRRFPRSRRTLTPLIEALHHWLIRPNAATRPTEDWLRAPTATR